LLIKRTWFSGCIDLARIRFFPWKGIEQDSLGFQSEFFGSLIIFERKEPMPIERQKEIKRRRNRKNRLKKLKAQLAQAKSVQERERLIDLIKRREPYFTSEKK
jgi:hypothetical protein